MIAALSLFGVVGTLSFVWWLPRESWAQVEERWLGLRQRSAKNRILATRMRRWELLALRPRLLAAEIGLTLVLLVLLPPLGTALLFGVVVLQLFCRARRLSRFFEERAQQIALELNLSVYSLLRNLSGGFYANVKDFAEEASRCEKQRLEEYLEALLTAQPELELERSAVLLRLGGLRKAFFALREESVCGRCLLSSRTTEASGNPHSYSERDCNPKKHLTLSTRISAASPAPLHFSAPCQRRCLRRVLRVWAGRFLPLGIRRAARGEQHPH